MSNTFGHLFRVTTWGESHGKAIGAVIDGVPSGICLDVEDIQVELDRRKPGQSKVTTERKEEDKVEILSGVFEGKTTGTPISLIIWNTDQRSEDYSKIKDNYRPQHADETYDIKYGFRDYRGGGRASARETATRVAAGAIAKRMFKDLGLKTKVIAYTKQIQELKIENPDFSVIEKNEVRAADMEIAEKMTERIMKLKNDGDSAGGIVEVQIIDSPKGLGEPVFHKIKAAFADAIMGINAVLGIEYGTGFEANNLKGSENNTLENGIYGGITNGKPIIIRAVFKPTSSIKLEGRHDPCLVPRAVPIVEAMCWLVLADYYLMDIKYHLSYPQLSKNQEYS